MAARKDPIQESTRIGLNLLEQQGWIPTSSEQPSMLDSSKEEINHNDVVGLDEEGYVTFLNLGSKRLYKGIGCCHAFSYFPRLAILNLGGTDLPLTDLVTILDVISSSIQTLYLGGNRLGSDGAQVVATWLRQSTPPKLSRLDLRYNEFANEGVTTLCQGLMGHSNNNAITHLYLEGNQIGDIGADALAKYLCATSTCKIQEIVFGCQSNSSGGCYGVGIMSSSE